MSDTEENQGPRVVLPGQQPAFPAHLFDHAAFDKHDSKALAEAAWAQASGSMEAYEALLRDHLNGDVDLLEIQSKREEAAAAAENPQEGEEAPRRRRGRRAAGDESE